jgi:hypothetical protein
MNAPYPYQQYGQYGYGYPPPPKRKRPLRRALLIVVGVFAGLLAGLVVLVDLTESHTTTTFSQPPHPQQAHPTLGWRAPAPLTPAAPPKPVGPQSAIDGDGTYQVGIDIVPGTYRSAGGANCYWERESDLSGTLGGIIANSAASGTQVVTILPSDAAFKTEGCGTWQRQ